jgi:hypothetical protein
MNDDDLRLLPRILQCRHEADSHEKGEDLDLHFLRAWMRWLRNLSPSRRTRWLERRATQKGARLLHPKAASASLRTRPA